MTNEEFQKLVLSELKEIKETQAKHGEILTQHNEYFDRIFDEFEKLGHFINDTQREFNTINKKFELVAEEIDKLNAYQGLFLRELMGIKRRQYELDNKIK